MNDYSSSTTRIIAQIMLGVNIFGRNVYMIGFMHIFDQQNLFKFVLRRVIVDLTGISWYYMRSVYIRPQFEQQSS